MGWPFPVKLLQSKFTVSNGATTRVSSTLHSTPSASLTFRLHLLIAVLSRLVIEQDKRPFAAVIFRRRSVPAFVLSVGLTITLAQYPMSTKPMIPSVSNVNALVFFLGCATVAGSDAGG